MGRIFNVLVPAIVLSAYFQGGSGSCGSGSSLGMLTGTGGSSGGGAGSGAFGSLFGQAESSGVSWTSGTAANTGTGFMNTGISTTGDYSEYSSGYTRGMGNSASGCTGDDENSAADGSGSAISNDFRGNFGSGGDSSGYSQGVGANNGDGSLGYSQGGGAYRGGFNAQYGSNSVSGGTGGDVQSYSEAGRSFMRGVAHGIADTVVGAIEVGQSLMQRPHVKKNYVQFSRPACVRQVVRVPTRVVSMRRGYVHRGCH